MGCERGVEAVVINLDPRCVLAGHVLVSDAAS